jgi:hypothetical protein
MGTSDKQQTASFCANVQSYLFLLKFEIASCFFFFCRPKMTDAIKQYLLAQIHDNFRPTQPSIWRIRMNKCSQFLLRAIQFVIFLSKTNYLPFQKNLKPPHKRFFNWIAIVTCGDIQARVTAVASRLPTYAPEICPSVNWMPPKSKECWENSLCYKFEAWNRCKFENSLIFENIFAARSNLISKQRNFFVCEEEEI